MHIYIYIRERGGREEKRKDGGMEGRREGGRREETREGGMEGRKEYQGPYPCSLAV